MSKYIDAEKLTKAIEDKGLDCSFALKMERLDTLALIDELQQEQPEIPSNLIDADAVRDDFVSEIYRVLDADPTNDRANAIIDAFDSLPTIQHEQPELSGYDKALLEVKSKVDEIYKETSIGLNEYDTGLYNGIAETCMKLRGFIKARLGFDEPPAVDLEKEIDNYVADNFSEAHDGVLLSDASGMELAITDIAPMARHFYELGLNARKEE